MARRSPTHLIDEALLFGAGASKEAGLPDTYELTERILRAFDHAPVQQRAALQLVIGGLIFQQGIERRDPLERPDAEAVFRAVETLADRNHFEGAPFVSWHPAVQALDVSSETDSRTGLNVYGQTSRRMLTVLCDLLWIRSEATEQLDYLAPLRSIFDRQGHVWVATLNYDNVLERFAAAVGVPYGTGLDSGGFNASRGYAFRFGVSGFHILKLHGSLNWTMHTTPKTPAGRGLVPQSFVLQRATPPDYSSMVDAGPALLFGGAKLTARGPFLTLLSMFQATIRQARRLTVVGYSFRDDHVNETLVEFLNQQSWSRLTVIDPFPKRVPEFVQRLLDACPERVTLVRKRAGEGLRELFEQA